MASDGSASAEGDGPRWVRPDGPREKGKHTERPVRNRTRWWAACIKSSGGRHRPPSGALDRKGGGMARLSSTMDGPILGDPCWLGLYPLAVTHPATPRSREESTEHRQEGGSTPAIHTDQETSDRRGKGRSASSPLASLSSVRRSDGLTLWCHLRRGSCRCTPNRRDPRPTHCPTSREGRGRHWPTDFGPHFGRR